MIEHAEGPSFLNYVDTLASLPANLIKDRKMEGGDVSDPPLLVAWQTKTSFTLGMDLATALSRDKQFVFRLRSVNRMGRSDHSAPSGPEPGLCKDAKQIAEEEEAEATAAAARGAQVKDTKKKKKKVGEQEEAAELVLTDELQPREPRSRDAITMHWNYALSYNPKNITHASADDEMQHLMKLAGGCTPRHVTSRHVTSRPRHVTPACSSLVPPLSDCLVRHSSPCSRLPSLFL